MKINHIYRLLGGILAISFGAIAESQTLRPGDVAPSLRVSRWLKDPTPALTRGTPYVVNFWSPSNPACAGSIRILTKLAKDYRGKATFLGLFIWNDQPKTAQSFLNKIGADHGYAMAIDLDSGLGRGASAKSWMAAAGMGALRFVPTSFVVGEDGRIRWIGSSFDLPNVIGRVLSKDWDVQSFARLFKYQQQRMNQQYILRADPLLQQLAAARSSVEAKKYRLALQQLDSIKVDKGSRAKLVSSLVIPMKLGVYRRMNDMEDYYRESRRASSLWSDDPHVLNALAWDIVNPANSLRVRDANLALTYAKRAVQLTGRQNANLLDTLAWAYWNTGDRPAAIATERSALSVAHATDKQEMTKTLGLFTGAKT